MKIYGLTGYPIEHSRSPEIFAAKFKVEHITDACYRLFPLKDINKLHELLKSQPGILGLNVTIPHKEKVLQKVDTIDETVRQTGAANTLKIIRRENNFSIHAFNTDVYGFEYSLTKHLQSHHKRALVLGSGGASKAVQYVLKKLQIPFLLISRKPDKSDQKSYGELNQIIMKQHQIIINATPQGMFPHINEMPDIPYQYLSDSHLLFDLIYNPIQTRFLEQGLKAGACIVNGEEMLLKQAEKSWEIWQDEYLYSSFFTTSMV